MLDNKKKLEDSILNLLDTSAAVQSKIRSICSPSQSSDIAVNPSAAQPNDTKTRVSDKEKTAFEERIKQLEAQLAQCQGDYKLTAAKMQECKNSSAQIQSKCSKLESEKSSLENKIACLEDEIKKANDNVRMLKERFFDPISLLERYRSLSVSIRTGLSDVICDKDEILFITSCSTPDHLKAIWGYTKQLAGSNGDANEIEVLKGVFDYFFDVFNNSLRDPMYERDSVETGYSFDDDKYDRCAGSATSGKITQVIMKGYKSTTTKTIICRSLVRV